MSKYEPLSNSLREIMSRYKPGEFDKLLEEAHPDVKEAFQILQEMVVIAMEQIRRMYDDATNLAKVIEELREDVDKMALNLRMQSLRRLTEALKLL